MVETAEEYDPRAAAALLDWWRLSGVDVAVAEEPRDWFAKPVQPAPAVVPAPADGAGGADLPDSLEAFLAWRGGPDAPDAAWGGDAVLASGPVDARVAVLCDLPDRDDCREGRLLTGAPGRLFDRMLAAAGLSRDAVHLLSLCARRPAAGRPPRDAEARLGEVARHHLGLVGPERLLLLGDAASRAVLGIDVGAARGRLCPVNHNGGTTAAVATRHPRFLLERPAAKADAWRDLRLLVGDMGG